jgi:hypothetical protein
MSIYNKESYSQSKVVYLAGPIEYWWDRFDTPMAKAYRWYRDTISKKFVERGYLVYRPWEAFKGDWNERMQILNDVAVERSDYLVNLTPTLAPTGLGTQHEIEYARDKGVGVIHMPMHVPVEDRENGYGGHWWTKLALEEIDRYFDIVEALDKEISA